MHLGRVHGPQWLVGLAGAALLASLFLDWYGRAGGEPVSGWGAFAVLDVVLALIAALALGTLAAAATQRAEAIPLAAASLSVLAGLVAVVAVTARLLAPPGLGGGVTTLAGAWIGLASAAALAVAALIDIRDDHSRGAAAPEVPVRRLENGAPPRRAGTAT